MISLAGGAIYGEFQGLVETLIEDVSTSIDLNLKSHIFITQLAVKIMKGHGCEDKFITLISSINALKSYGLPVYSAAKAGLLGLVRASAAELGQFGIRINAVVPGTVLTPRTVNQPKNFEKLKEGTVLGRLTTTQEVARVITSLSVDFTCVTGQFIVADAGQTIKAVQ